MSITGIKLKGMLELFNHNPKYSKKGFDNNKIGIEQNIHILPIINGTIASQKANLDQTKSNSNTFPEIQPK